MKLQQNKHNKQHFINLPMQIVLALGWSKGQELQIKVADKGKLLLYEKKE